MSPQHARRFSRRRFLGAVMLAGTAGLLGVHPRSVAGEPPPETTTLRLARTTSICHAPQYGVEALFEAEGFTEVQLVGDAATTDRTLVSGEAQMGMLFLGPFLLHLDAGAPLVILSGGHVGCQELFAHAPTFALGRSAFTSGQSTPVMPRLHPLPAHPRRTPGIAPA